MEDTIVTIAKTNESNDDQHLICSEDVPAFEVLRVDVNSFAFLAKQTHCGM